VNCYPECNGECETCDPVCSHESWEITSGGGATCADCGKYLSKEYMEARASELPYWVRLRGNIAPSATPPKVFIGDTEITDLLLGTGEIRITDERTGGQKGQKLERHALVPQHPQDEVARVYGYGASKYSDHNWRRGYNWSLSLDALYRHVAQFRKGESVDPESGHHHLAHAAFHLNTLMEFERLGLGTDDRVDTRPMFSEDEKLSPWPGPWDGELWDDDDDL
jgi:hypothetical protein